jgi:hypothetical protein
MTLANGKSFFSLLVLRSTTIQADAFPRLIAGKDQLILPLISRNNAVLQS